MEYSVGSLADLITGSNTPNKPKVLQQEFKKIRNENIVTPNIQKSAKKKAKIENNKRSLNTIKHNKTGKLQNKNAADEENITQSRIQKVNNKQKKIKKRIVDSIPSVGDIPSNVKTVNNKQRKIKKRKVDSSLLVENTPSDVNTVNNKQMKINKKKVESILSVGDIPSDVNTVNNKQRKIKRKVDSVLSVKDTPSDINIVNKKQMKIKKRKVDSNISVANTPSDSAIAQSKKGKLSKVDQSVEKLIKSETNVSEAGPVSLKQNTPDFISLTLDTENEDVSEKDKLSKNDENAERRIKNKKKKEKKLNNNKDSERTLYVGNIPIQINKEKIKKYFKKYGRIETMRIRGIAVADPKMSKKVAAIKKEFNPKRKNAFCYIRFANKEDAVSAQVEDGVLFEEHHLRVHVCSSKEEPDETKAIFVGNLSFDAEEDELWKLFETCGPISHVRIIRDSKTGMGKGFAYVNFKESDAVQLALEMEGVKLRDRELRITLSNLRVARKKKSNKNKKNTQPREFRDKRNKKKNVDDTKSTDDQGIRKTNTGFQGTKFSDKRKKYKVNKGFVQRKMKKIAPKN